MKILSILVMVLAFSGQLAFAADGAVDYSGDWFGTCKVESAEFPSEKKIAQEGHEAIVINGQRFDLTKPTVISMESDDQGEKYSELTVYDFQWGEDGQQILTSARWVGWYKDKPGSWSGSGVGVIRLENGRLITTRAFEGKEEFCTYEKKN